MILLMYRCDFTDVPVKTVISFLPTETYSDLIFNTGRQSGSKPFYNVVKGDRKGVSQRSGEGSNRGHEPDPTSLWVSVSPYERRRQCMTPK